MELFLGAAAAHLLALASPGPDLFLVIRLALARGFRAGVSAALGIMLGLCVHIGFSLTLLGTLRARYPGAFTVLGLAGAGYLIYLGVGALGEARAARARGEPAPARPGSALRQGLLCNLLNAKAAFYFWSLFSVLFEREVSDGFIAALAALMLTVEVGFFSAVSWLVSRARETSLVRAYFPWATGAMGVLLILLGLSVVAGQFA